MTPEERFAGILERIAERHAALAQSVELLAHVQQEGEAVRQRDQAFLRERFAQVADTISRLDDHQQRLDDLEK